MRNPKSIADALADAVDEDWLDTDDEQFHALRMTPSIVNSRHFIGLESTSGKAYLITIEEV